MRVLIIKLTSMGDLMHALPALTDAVNHNPDIRFDWVVDEGFSEVPKWHPAVDRVITTAHRRWKKTVWQCVRRGEFGAFMHELNLGDYDVVVDFQSNLKSAFVSWLRRGDVHGYDRKTCREKPAHWAYAHHYSIPLRQHAIERQRQLLAKILDYPLPNTPSDYGVNLQQYRLPQRVGDISLPEKYVVFVHNASWPTKLWPQQYWQQLIERVVQQGYSVLLPSGSEAEYQRAQVMAQCSPKAIALPKTMLNEMAAIMSHAQAAVCSDTGLAHMAAVANAASITLYAVTDTVLIGTVGKNQQHVMADKQSLKASMSDIDVETIWQRLSPLLDCVGEEKIRQVSYE